MEMDLANVMYSWQQNRAQSVTLILIYGDNIICKCYKMYFVKYLQGFNF